jgi:hypothetical protein
VLGHSLLEGRCSGGIFILGVCEEHAAGIVNGVHPVLVLASSFAPRSASNCNNTGLSGNAAAWSAVLPLQRGSPNTLPVNSMFNGSAEYIRERLPSDSRKIGCGVAIIPKVARQF